MVVVAELGHVHITMSHYVVLLDYYWGVCHTEDATSIGIIKAEID